MPPDVSEVEPLPPAALPVKRQPDQRPIIVGMGPAGLFCALELAERGVKSILLDRGRDVIQRRKDVAKLMRDGTLMPESNMSFGEGGAGAYTDGKLSTRINHPSVRRVIETFAKYGAPDRILVQGKPHIGSDLLPFAVERMRKDLESMGVAGALRDARRRHPQPRRSRHRGQAGRRLGAAQRPGDPRAGQLGA